MMRPTINPKPSPLTFVIFCGTQHGALGVVPFCEHAAGETGYYPGRCGCVVLDTTTGQALPTDIQRITNIVPLNADLKARMEFGDKHPIIAKTLRDIPRRVLPDDLSDGSMKIIAISIAAFQVRWLVIREAIYSGLRELQQIKTGGEPIHCLTVGGAFGGVGGIVQILAAAAIRTLIRNDLGLGDALTISGIFVMPESSSLDMPRISANSKATFELLQMGQRGEFSLPVPGEEPYKQIGGNEPIYDHVFAVGESSMAGAIPGHDAFRRVLARFMTTWVGPIGDSIRSQLVEPQYKNMEVTI